MSDGLPKIVDPVGFTGGHDVVVDGADFGACVFVFDEAEGGHEFSRIAADEDGENVSRKWKRAPEGIRQHGCILGLTPKIIAKSDGVFTLPKAPVTVLRGKRERTSEGAKSGSNRGLEKLFEEEAGEAASVVTEYAVFFEEIVEDDAEAKLLEVREIDDHGFGALRAITACDIGRDGLPIGNDPIDHSVRNVLLDRAQMIREGVAGGFAGLGHEIGHVHARGLGFGNGIGDFRNPEIGQDAGVERAGAEEYEVGVLDGINHQRKRAHLARRESDPLYRRAAGGDARFAVDGASVLERGDEMDVRKR